MRISLREDEEISSSGSKYWRFRGVLHREDGPAVEQYDGYRAWYKMGSIHREDGPALIYPSGQKEWRLHNLRHREDGPAVEFPDGTKEWYLDGQYIKSGEQPDNWNELVGLYQVKRVMND